MVKVTIESGKLVCEVEGSHKFWACKSRLEVPIEHVKGVKIRSEDTQRWWHGWKVIGADIPGKFAAGIFSLNGKWVFWDVLYPEKAIEIDLADDSYGSLLVEVEDPDATAALIQSAIVV